MFPINFSLPHRRALRRTIPSYAKKNVLGINITIPHKQDVVEYLDGVGRYRPTDRGGKYGHQQTWKIHRQ